MAYIQLVMQNLKSMVKKIFKGLGLFWGAIFILSSIGGFANRDYLFATAIMLIGAGIIYLCLPNKYKNSIKRQANFNNQPKTFLETAKDAVENNKDIEWSGSVSDAEMEEVKRLYPQIGISQKSRSTNITYTEEEIRDKKIEGLNFIAIDFETANAKRNSACAIGIVIVKDGLEVERYYRLIRPIEMYFNPMNVRVHGIKERDVLDAPTFDKVWDEFKDKITQNLLIAHNAASFDMSVLRACLESYNLEIPSLKYACTMEAAKAIGWSPKLKDLSVELNIPLEHHNALSDAICCANIAIEIHKKNFSDKLNERELVKSFAPQIYQERKVIPVEKSAQKSFKHIVINKEDSLAEMKLKLITIRTQISKCKKQIDIDNANSKPSVFIDKYEHLLSVRDAFIEEINKKENELKNKTNQ